MAGSVLVVDDDPSFLSELQRSLVPHGIAIDTASDVQTATAMLEENHYCGLVIDLVLANGSGIDLVQRISDRQPGVPVVLMTDRIVSNARQLLAEEQVKLVLSEQIPARTLSSIVLGLCGIAA